MKTALNILTRGLTLICMIVSGLTIGAYIGGARLVPPSQQCERVAPQVDLQDDIHTRLVWSEV